MFLSPVSALWSADQGRFIVFELEVNPKGGIDFDGRGYYAILFNSQAQAIEVTNPETFTDFIRYDGMNFLWFHRQDNVPPPGYSWVSAGNINRYCGVSSDNRKLTVVFNLDDPGIFFNQYLANPCFTMQAVTSDTYKSSIIGRTIDTMGPGPDIIENSLNTVYVSRELGVLSPYPAFYPMDPLKDWITVKDLPPDFPYPDFDLFRLRVDRR